MKLSYNSTFMYQANGVSHGISADTQSQYEEHIQDSFAGVDTKISDKEYGFIEILKDEKAMKETKNVSNSLRWAKYLVVVGIGGSDLGARAIQDAIEADEPPMVVYFHGDTTDPKAITRLLKLIDLDETVFCIISKSGETIETISQYVFFKNILKKQVDDWTMHFLFITDEKKGILREEADTHKILTLAIPDTVGGRFSVQTTVGLLPAMMMGVDIEELVKGMQSVVDEQTDVAKDIAQTQFLLAQQGLKVNILMTYSVQLQEFGRWYRQLWAESLGKEGKGILPIKAWGPADQHSQAQFYTEGELLHSLLFLRVETTDDNYTIEDVDVDQVKYLEGHDFHSILLAEQESTALALKKLDRPSATLSIEKVNAYTLGQLFMVFELAVVYLAELFEINAFDQPGVEEGKQMMYALLDRKGWEEKKAEVEELRG